MSDRPSAAVQTDLQGLAGLRALANENSPHALRAAAEQFEALLVQMMLKSMREANLADGLFDSQFSRLYKDIFDQQLAGEMARGKGIGLADMIVKQLQPLIASGEPASDAGQVPGEEAVLKRFPGVAVSHYTSVSHPSIRPEGQAPTSALPQDTQSATGWAPSEFVQQLWPYAENAARALGVSPRVLVAQAALETGWGRGIPRHSDGRSSHNLFGIKADAKWQGERLTLPTLEYIEDVAVRTPASFRSYPSYGESFADYVDFLRSNPRYARALQLVDNSEGFARALRDAGYATDPSYARKIIDILNGEVLTQAVVDLKLPQPTPLSESTEGRSRIDSG